MTLIKMTLRITVITIMTLCIIILVKMLLIKNTQNISKGSFAFVPVQNFSEPWNDEKLYKKYGISKEEVQFIESMIRPMDQVIE